MYTDSLSKKRNSIEKFWDEWSGSWGGIARIFNSFIIGPIVIFIYYNLLIIIIFEGSTKNLHRLVYHCNHHQLESWWYVSDWVCLWKYKSNTNTNMNTNTSRLSDSLNISLRFSFTEETFYSLHLHSFDVSYFCLTPHCFRLFCLSFHTPLHLRSHNSFNFLIYVVTWAW